MATPDRAKVDGRYASKGKSHVTTNWIFKSDGGRGKGRSEGERGRVGTEKRPKRRRPAGIGSGG